MPPDIVLDFGAPTKRRRRSKRDINRFWNSRYNRFLKAGFSEIEAKWAADQGLSPRHKQVRLVLRHRKNLVAWYMRHGYTRMGAIAEAEKDLETKLEEAGEPGLNLFYEVSP